MLSLRNSQLYDQTNFYDTFMRDLRRVRSRVVIKSSFVTEKRMMTPLPILRQLQKKDVRIIINTKPFEKHKLVYGNQAIWAVGVMRELGIDDVL